MCALSDINASIQHLCVKGSVEEVGSERSSRNLEEDDKEDTSGVYYHYKIVMCTRSTWSQ